MRRLRWIWIFVFGLTLLGQEDRGEAPQSRSFRADAISGAARGGTEPIAVETHMLKNGLKLLIHEDHSIPTVVTYIFYRIGSRNEGPGTTGLSHFFEHMMFNGAKKYGPGELDKFMEANGGGKKADTPRDVNAFQNLVSRVRLRLRSDIDGCPLPDLTFDTQ